MKIGFARTEITPPIGTYLSGQLLPVKAINIESPLYATAMCLDDGTAGVLLCSCDILMIPNQLNVQICSDVAKTTGLPKNNIVVCATHIHSGPNVAEVFGKGANEKYIKEFRRNLTEVMKKAWAVRQEGILKTVKGNLPGLAFNRRFVMSSGTVETHPLKCNPHIVQAEGPDSKQLDVLYACNVRGKPLGAAIVFGCHATVMERDNKRISSDYPGKASGGLARRLGKNAKVLFLQGASGNICQVNPRDTSRYEVGLSWAKRMGREIAACAFELIEEKAKAVSGRVRILNKTIHIPCRNIYPGLLSWARKHKKNRPVDIPSLSNYGVEKYGQARPPVMALEDVFKTQFWADFYADEIKTMERLRRKEPNVEFTIKVIAIGDWSLVALPCELFVEWAGIIRSYSPFKYTMVVELANGWNGYVPTPKAFERSGGYETKELSTTMLVPEAGSMIVECVINMLHAAKRLRTAR
ncbi:MAG: neutral/alkaline non-lysosomal ceramidase N-terminal domain-containing protein [Candidatus Omnitrophota bacterium]